MEMIVNLLCSIMLIAGADTIVPQRAETPQEGINKDAVLVTDTISRAPSDEHCSVELLVDYPVQGKKQLVDNIRSYIANEMESFYITHVYGDGTASPAHYEGSLDDGKALVDFHAEHILADMKDNYQTFVDSTGLKSLYMMDQSSIRKTSENDSIVTYEAACYQYEGGAHGQYWLEGATFSKIDGERIEINIDPFDVNDMQPLLREGLEKYLNDKGQGTTVEELMNGGIFLTDGIIPLPSSTPYLTAEGVKFVYGEYEIGPYILGTPNFTIPLDKIRPFLIKDEQ